MRLIDASKGFESVLVRFQRCSGIGIASVCREHDAEAALKERKSNGI